MSKLFNNVQFVKPKKNKFDLSHERKMSMKMGTLTPFLVQEVLPGDSFRVNTEMMLRMQPMLAPIYHRVRVKTDYFFVPNRLVWDNWQKFITGGDKGEDLPNHPHVIITDTNKNILTKGQLADFLGVPAIDQTATVVAPLKISVLPFRAYTLVYDEFYRDQNLIDPSGMSKADGQMSGSEIDRIMWLRQRAWEKDYFTSCLPWAQKGGAVELPADVEYRTASKAINPSTGQPWATGSLDIGVGGEIIQGNNTSNPVQIDNIESLGMTVQDLRVSVRLQEWLERQARAGSRYIETILSNWGVLSSDARLQRPEYLGGSMNPIVISEIVSTYQDPGDTGYPQGNMAGHGISTGGNGGFKKSFEEHGFVIGIMTVLPRTAYQNGVSKSFTRFDKFDYAWPSFAQLGEQPVLNKELFYDPIGGTTTNEGTFGYQSRYAEYKYQASTVHGDFRDSLDYWHMGRKFSALPVLNKSFIEANPDKRIFAVTTDTEDEILCQIYNRVDALRSLPYFNSPSL